MIDRDNNNRRSHPRKDTTITLEIADILKENGELVFMANTQNISASGMYCKVNKYIPLLTKVGGVLELPIRKKTKDKDYKIEKVIFKGVVVRIEPGKKKEDQKEYKLALFFQDMLEADINKINRFISSTN